MALNAKKAGNGGNNNRVEQPVIEPDVYPSYLVQLIDLGLQPQREFKGKAKPPVQEIMLTYELSDVFMVDEDGNEQEDKSRWISETLPFYGLFADKAKSTQRYLTFDPDESFDGDFSKAVGMPCNVTVVNNPGKDGKVYTNVGNVAAISEKKAAKMNELKNPTKVFDLDDPDMEVFNSLPDWIQDKIKSNLNFKGSVLEAALENGGKEDKPEKAKVQEVKKAGAKKAVKEDPPFDPDEDDNPY